MLLCLGKKSCHGNYYFLLDLSHSKYYLFIRQTFSTLSRYDHVEHSVERKLSMFIFLRKFHNMRINFLTRDPHILLTYDFRISSSCTMIFL